MAGGQQRVGRITPRVKALLELSCHDNAPIYMGAANIAHMQTEHPKAYAKYGALIPQILRAPDYVGKNPKDNSIEYVKEFLTERDYVKVAVRVSAGGTFFARTLYVLQPNRVNNFIQKGTLKRV